ncbi:MAG: hypothetical protein EBU90_26865, partial [Proteobacteria bacterium]|nr:hypothetical protein [Pseudomonadota bacterium]
MTEKQLSQFMKDQAGGLMSKFNPLNLARGLFGSNKAGSKTGDVIGTDRQKLKAAVSKGKDPEFTTIGSSDRTSVRRGDSVANIAAKMYNLINRDYNNTKKESNIENKLAKTLSIKKEKRHKELLAALTAAPKQKGVELKVPKKEENKMPTVTQPSVTPKPSAPTGATPKPVTPQAAPKPTPGQPVTAAPKPAPTAAPKPTPGQPMAAPKPAPSVAGPKPTPTKPPVTAAPKPPTTATPAVPPTPPAAVQATPAVSTATKVAVGAALATTATASFAAGPLAENIVAHESKVSSPLSRDGRKMATKWKNNTEYNAYNKGTKIAADFDEKGESVIDFSKMTIEEYLKRGAIKDPKNPKKIFAMGRYQIIPSTMEYLVKELKIDPKTT